MGRTFGVELTADFSLLLIFVLIVTNLGFGAFASLHPEWGPVRVWSLALSAALLFFGSVVLHELAHALVGRAFGIPIKRITLFIFGGMTHAEREPPSPRAEFMMAAAGPVVSLSIAFASAALGSALVGPVAASHADDALSAMREAGPLATLLLWLAPVNLMLALFNLVPGFPLDGGRVLRSVLWWATGDLEKATRWASLMGQAFAWFLMACGAFLMFGYFVPGLGGGLVQGLWLMLIGWFLNNAARLSFQQVHIEKTLERVPVRDVMRSRVETVSPYLSLSTLVRDYVMNTNQSAFPVVQEDLVVGLVQMEDVRRVPRERWDEVRVSEVMAPAGSIHTASPDDDALQVMRELAEQTRSP